MIRTPRLTSASIALANLDAEVGRLLARLEEDLEPADAAELVDHLLVRAAVTGDAADAAAAEAWSARAVEAAPRSGTARLGRARCLAYQHRFAEAVVELEQAARLGAAETDLVTERVSLLQASGCLDEAVDLCERTARRRRDSGSLGQLACLYAAAGRRPEAEETFDGAVRAYRSVSPIAFAALCCDWAHAMEHDGNPDEAVTGYLGALDAVPTHDRARRALGHLLAGAGSGSHH